MSHTLLLLLLTSRGPQEATELNNRAVLEYKSGDYAQAESHYLAAITEWKLLGQEHEAELAKAYNNLAVLFRQQARFAEAERFARHSARIRPCAPAFQNLGEILRLQGRLAEAETALIQASSLADEAIEGQVMQSRAALVQEMGDLAAAERLQRRAAESLERWFGAGNPVTLNAHANLAQNLSRLGRWTEAEAILARTLPAMESIYGDRHPRVAAVVNNLAQCYRMEGRLAEAEPLLRQAIQIWETVLGGGHPDVAKALVNLGGLFEQQGKLRGAARLYLRALQISEASLGKDHPQAADAARRLALVWAKQGRQTEAQRLLSGFSQSPNAVELP